MSDFKRFLKQEEISIQAINSLVCNAIVCDICHKRSANKIVYLKAKMRKKYGISSAKICCECNEENI